MSTAWRATILELRDKWLLIFSSGIGVGISAAALPFYTIGIFIIPLQEEFGWSRGDITLGISISSGMLALASPLVGAIADRFGERLLIPSGLVVVCLIFASLSLVSGNILHFWLAYALIGVLGAGASTLVFSRLVALNFGPARGTALAIMLLGLGVTSALAPLLLGDIVAREGWRSGYQSIALACAVLGVVVTAGIWRSTRSGPPRAHEPVEGKKQHSLPFLAIVQSRVFWLMSLAFCASILAISGMVSHIVPLLIDRGATAQEAAGYAALIGVFMIGGRLLSGILIDRLYTPRVGALFALLSSAGLLLLSLGGSYSAIAGVIAIGIMMGAELDLAAYFVSRYFHPNVFGKAYGVLYALIVFGSMVSISGYGYWVDVTGQYSGALRLASASLAVAGVVFILHPPFHITPVDDEQ